MSTLSIGAMRWFLTLEEKVYEDDHIGGYGISYRFLKSIWGHIEPISGKETEWACVANTYLRHKIYVRKDSDLKIGMRLIYRERIFDIIAILERYKNSTYSICMCEEKNYD